MRARLAAWFERTAPVRWLAVLPGGLLSGLAIQFPLHWTVIIGTTFFRSGPESDNSGLSVWNIPAERLEQFAVALIVPAVVVYMAGKIAPTHRFTTALVLAGVGLVGYGLLIGYVIGSTDMQYESPFLDLVLPLALNVTGIGIGLRNVRQLPEPARGYRAKGIAGAA